MALSKMQVNEYGDEKDLYWRITMVRILSPKADGPTNVRFEISAYPSRQHSVDGSARVDKKTVKLGDLKKHNVDQYNAVKNAFYDLIKEADMDLNGAEDVIES